MLNNWSRSLGKCRAIPGLCRNPNSPDNSKMMLAQLYQASQRHTRNWLICILKTFFICFVILTQQGHYHFRGENAPAFRNSPGFTGKEEGIPHTGAQWQGKAALQSILAREAECSGASHAHSLYRGTGFPATCSAMRCPLSLHRAKLTFMGAPRCTKGFSWEARTSREQTVFAGLLLLLWYASRQQAYLNLSLKLSDN